MRSIIGCRVKVVDRHTGLKGKIGTVLNFSDADSLYVKLDNREDALWFLDGEVKEIK